MPNATNQTDAQRCIEAGKAMSTQLTDIVSREQAAAEMKASFLRTLTPDLAAEMLAEALLQLTENR
jgi:hypothetical protein